MSNEEKKELNDLYDRYRNQDSTEKNPDDDGSRDNRSPDQKDRSCKVYDKCCDNECCRFGECACDSCECCSGVLECL